MRLLNLAPHCSIPPMDGADRRAWHLNESMVSLGVDARFIAQKIISDRGDVSPLPGKRAGWRERKDIMAVFALLSGQDYWQFKMLTPAFRRAVDQVDPREFDAAIIHFLYSLPLIRKWRGIPMRLVIETHNYDPDIYGGVRNSTRNPLLRLLCDRAIETSLRTLQALPNGTTLVHVSESDSAAYQEIRPDLEHVVIENGCRLAPRSVTPDYHTPAEKQLIFVGSLYAKMNQDALVNFSRVYWPLLRGIARMRVVGSHPPAAVLALCAAEGWELCANVTDAELEGYYSSAHYAVAPFTYGAGSKLKLMEACGRGVPILATQAGVTGMAQTPPCLYVTDEPKEWKRIVLGGPPPAQAVAETLAFAEQVSWPCLAAKLMRKIENADLVTLP